MPQAYLLALADGYTSLGLNLYRKDDSGLVTVNIFVKRSDDSNLPTGILTLATMPEGYRPTGGRPMFCGKYSPALTGLSGSGAINIYVDSSGAINCHVSTEMGTVANVAASLFFYAD